MPPKNWGEEVTNDGHPRDITVDLSCGLIANPNANPVCTEAQLFMEELFGCPDASQVGLADTPLHNMVSPPGMAA